MSLAVYNSLSTAEFDEIMRLAKLYGLPVIGHGVPDPMEKLNNLRAQTFLRRGN